MDKLSLEEFSDKDVISQFISLNKTLTDSNKTLTSTIEILIHNGTGNMVQANQKFKKKQKSGEKIMYPNWIQRYFSGHMDTRLYTVTQFRLAQLGDKSTINHPPRQTQWEVVNKL